MKLSELLKNEWKNMDVEECAGCGHIVAKGSMQEVRSGYYIWNLIRGSGREIRYSYYCSSCKLPYDYIGYGGTGLNRYYKKVNPFIEVDKNGEEVVAKEEASK